MQFATGSLDPTTTRVRIELDVDRNAATGNREQNGMGSDYSVLFTPNNSQVAAVQRYAAASCATGGPCGEPVGRAPAVITGDTLLITIPLALIDNRDGHLYFLIKTWPVVERDSLVGSTDYLPEATLPAGKI
jgi:hypothetical protein